MYDSLELVPMAKIICADGELHCQADIAEKRFHKYLKELNHKKGTNITINLEYFSKAVVRRVEWYTHEADSLEMVYLLDYLMITDRIEVSCKTITEYPKILNCIDRYRSILRCLLGKDVFQHLMIPELFKQCAIVPHSNWADRLRCGEESRGFILLTWFTGDKSYMDAGFEKNSARMRKEIARIPPASLATMETELGIKLN